MKERIFLATGNLFPVTGIKEYLVSQYIFYVNERLFLVTGNKFPVTGRTKITLCHMKNISWHRRHTSFEIDYILVIEIQILLVTIRFLPVRRIFPLTGRKTD